MITDILFGAIGGMLLLTAIEEIVWWWLDRKRLHDARRRFRKALEMDK